MTHRSIDSRPSRLALILTIAGSAVLLSGCSNKDDAKEAVSQANLEFRKVSIGDSTYEDGFSKEAYSKADELTKDFAGNGQDYGEGAAVAQSLAKLGLATLAGDDASTAETDSMHQSRVIRGHLSEWIAMNSVALATTNLDISDEKQALSELITLREADVVQYTKLHESLQEEIDAYQVQIDDLDAKAVNERNESARFELQMTSVSATQAAQLAQRVREHSLRADGYELESDRLQGRVGQLLPGAHEIELQVQKAKDQITLLQESIYELEQRVRDSKQDSAQARADAEQAHSEITRLIDALEEYRSSTVIPASERVISTLRQSIRAAGGANDVVKVSGSLAKASGQEQLARALSRQARGEAEMVSLYQAIEGAGLAGDWESMIQSHTTKRDELYGESKQAFQDSASSLRRARMRGESGDALEAAAVRLDQLGGVEPEPEYNEEYESDESDFDESEFEDEMDGEVDPDAEELDEEG